MKAARRTRNSLIALLVFAAPAFAEEMRVEEVTVVTASGKHVFKAEIADTPDLRSKGLMFRTSLEADRAMLFDFGKERPVAMWMKNTYVPLDMFFIRADGSIAGIKRNATPESTATIQAKEPVKAVLEVVAGTADRIGAEQGDKVVHGMFAQ